MPCTNGVYLHHSPQVFVKVDCPALLLAASPALLLAASPALQLKDAQTGTAARLQCKGG